ncbi:glycosyltransferase family 4 protein [Telmatocola sphagniphila]|uniref:Glycosyltransferase family 4 protein n=2 Tax=Telmatocola sphagniphila TaxID=1123043 RepID=A0A8E6EUJ8_9BACT|nr:glycosyltransferase family 4 protein [Telmatocola sphagniphila]
MEPEFALCFHGRLWDELHATGVVVHHMEAVRLSRFLTIFRARTLLKRLLVKSKFDVIMIHGAWPYVVFAPVVKSTGIKLVAGVHDRLDRKGFINRWASRTSPDLIIANSKFTEEPAAKLFGGRQSRVIYLPVNKPPRNKDGDSLRRTIRSGLDTPQDSVVILQACRLERWKGHSVTIEALGQLKDLPGWRAWIAGGVQKSNESDYMKELRDLATRYGISERVHFLGQRSDVPSLMAAADIYCQPNTSPEPFGLVYIEALLAGLPVIGSSSGGAAEIFSCDCSISCKQGDTEAVGKAMKRLITDRELRKKMSEAGAVRATHLCDASNQMNKLYKALQSLST